MSLRTASFAWAAMALLTSACGGGFDTEISGELSYMPMMGADSMMIEYETNRFAVIYVGEKTRLQNIEEGLAGVVWTLGGEHSVRGMKTSSREFPNETPPLRMESSVDGEQSIDLWIDATTIRFVR